MNRRWLKQCKGCRVEFWGDASDTGYCISCAETSTGIMECMCGCGKLFERKDNPNPKYVKKYYSRACQMRARRRTEAGKAYTERYNQRYKRPEREWVCKFPMCGKIFMSTHKRSYCDEHSNPSSQQVVWRKKNPAKVKAHSVIGGIYRDRGYSTTRKREACVVCGCEKSEAHHHDYKKPRDVIFLCKDHHVELHSWDSN